MSTIATVTPIASKRMPGRVGQSLQWLGTITGTASYATGGDTLSPKSLGMNAIEGAIFAPFNNHLIRAIVQTDGSVKLFITTSNTGAELANTTSWATEVPFCSVWGH